MKPDEIKEALECCRHFDSCRKCPFNKVKDCREVVSYESLEYINQLEAENERLNKKVEGLLEMLFHSAKFKVSEIKSEEFEEFLDKFNRENKLPWSAQVVLTTLKKNW